MADETKEIIHQHYANATAAIAAMNDQNWAYEEAANRIIVMDGATPVYFETAARLIAGGSFIVNQTASPQSGGFSVSGNGLIGGTFTLTGIQTNSAEIAAGASLAMRRTIDTGYLAVSGGNAINSGANLVMNGGSHASGANDWSFRAGATDKLVWDDSASLLTLSGGISATTGSFSSTLGVTGIQTNSEALVFTGSGTGGAGRIFNSASNGLNIRANTGSDYDFYLSSASNNTLIRNPTGGTILEMPGSAVTIGGNLSLSALSSGRIPVVSTSGLITQGSLYFDNINARLGIGDTALYDFVIVKSTAGEVRAHILNQDTGASAATTLYLGTAATGSADTKIVVSNGTTTYSFGLDDSASDAFVLSLGGTLGTSNVMSISTAGAVTFNYGVVLVSTLYLFGTTTFDGTVCFTDTETAGAGGTNWTNETDIDVSGANSAEITPTADSQTYKFTNPTSGQILTVTNAHASYNIYIDLTDGSGTATQYINAGRMCLFRYNGTRWYSTY